VIAIIQCLTLINKRKCILIAFALSIFHVDKCMTWHQVKKMSSSSFSISAWSTSHYFFKHCSHDSQYLKQLFYLISFHQLLDDIVNVMKMFQYQRSQWIANSLITCSYNFQTLHLSCLITSSIFLSFRHWHVINLLHKSIVIVRRKDCCMSENSAW